MTNGTNTLRSRWIKLKRKTANAFDTLHRISHFTFRTKFFVGIFDIFKHRTSIKPISDFLPNLRCDHNHIHFAYLMAFRMYRFGHSVWLLFVVFWPVSLIQNWLNLFFHHHYFLWFVIVIGCCCCVCVIKQYTHRPNDRDQSSRQMRIIRRKCDDDGR